MSKKKRIKKWLVEFGRNPALSFLELIRYFETNEISHKLILWREEICIFEAEQKDVLNLCFKLGGTKILAEVIMTPKIDEITNEIVNYPYYFGDSKYIDYQITLYGLYSQGLASKLDSILKKMFKKDGYRPGNKVQNLSQLARLDLQEYVDLRIFCGDLCYVAQTISCSNPMENKHRMEKRPNSDYKIMTSVRLSKILLNLAGNTPGKKLLDPFCGLGTIVGEAMLQGFEASGLEINEERAKECIENLAWLSDEYEIETPPTIEQGNARELSHLFPLNSFDVVVTEGELGPFLEGLPSEKTVEGIVTQLTDLYSAVLREISRILKPEGQAVIVIPQFVTKHDQRISLPLNIEKNFEIVRSAAMDEYGLQNPYLYKEDWHLIERLIFILTPKTA